MRRFTRSIAPPPGGIMTANGMASQVRCFTGIPSFLCSCMMCVACMWCFGSWANNYCNVKKYGRWRFRNAIDDVIMVSDFKTARYIGSFFGLLFWWFVVGPKKYSGVSNLEQVPSTRRFGPF